MVEIYLQALTIGTFCILATLFAIATVLMGTAFILAFTKEALERISRFKFATVNSNGKAKVPA